MLGKDGFVFKYDVTMRSSMSLKSLSRLHFCYQNNSYEITINGFQVRKINEIRNVIFGLRYGKPSSALRPKLGCSPSWVLDDIQRFLGQPCLNKHKFVTYVNSKEKSENNLQIPFFLSSDRRSDNVAAEFPKFSDLYRELLPSIISFAEIVRQLWLIKVGNC